MTDIVRRNTPPALPVSKKTIVKYNLKEIDFKDLTEVLDNIDYFINISKEDLNMDMSLLKELTKNEDNIFLFKDFDTIKSLDSIINFKINNKVVLIDDGLLRDRSYIDLTTIKNMDVTVPLQYAMWGLKFNEVLKIYNLTFLTNSIKNYLLQPSNNKLTIEDYKKLRNTIEELTKYNPTTDIDKIYLTSDYIQSKTQFIQGFENPSSKGSIICPDFNNNRFDVSHYKYFQTVLNNNYGVCNGIADLTTLLLNNEIMKVEIESLSGLNHMWNRVLLDGKYYFLDNTWCITRSSDSPSDSLITYSFNDEYLLFGSDKAKEIGHHNPESIYVYNHGEDSKDDYHKVVYSSKYNYLKEPIYKSYKK